VSSPDAVTVAPEGAPSHLVPWYGSLARLLASSAPPAAVLLESSSDRSLVSVTVRPPALVNLVRNSPAGITVRVEASAASAPRPPSSLEWERVGTLVQLGSSGLDRPGEERPVVDRLGAGWGVSDGSWLGVQTFWLPGRHGNLWLARRFRFAARTRATLDNRADAVGASVAAQWSLTSEAPASFRFVGFGSRRDWERGGFRTIPRDGWFERPPEVAARSAFGAPPSTGGSGEISVETPGIVLGASGSGKTTYLARWAAFAVERGEALFALDLHGDLGPAILARLPARSRVGVVAVDASAPPIPGIAALTTEGSRDRAAAHLVAALKRLSPDGTDIYWGFRLERIFDTFVRLALEAGGTLTDVYDLLTDPDRRDASRLATRSSELARFLDELAPVVRRNPEFLWSAATRLSKVVLVPALRELLAPEEGGLPVESLLENGRAVLVRLPFASLGPEAVGFAAALVLTRVYLGVAAVAERQNRPLRVAVVLDEVQALSPRLVAELLSEGRKFGLRTIVATQYPERLSRELESAARGALRGFVTFRVPQPSAREVGVWLGLGPVEARALLPHLPTGQGLALDSFAERIRPIPPEAAPPPFDPARWTDAVVATRKEFSTKDYRADGREARDATTERVLLATLSRTEMRTPIPREEAVAAALSLPGPGVETALLHDRLGELLREGTLLDETAQGLRLTPAGERWLGLTAPTGAARETGEHRALLMAAFRAFARRGYRLEIVRQGRFDTTLPDARLRLLPGRDKLCVPADLRNEVEQARTGWAWRFFHGRDVHVEAEVSGALRAERVRHGVQKALHRGAFVLFVVGDAYRARRVRAVLRSMGLGVDRAQVWTLPVRTPLPCPDLRTNR